MTDQAISAAVAPSDDLRSTLEAAFVADFRGSETPPAEEAAAAEASAKNLSSGVDPGGQAADDRPDGRFTPKTADTESPDPAGRAAAQPVTQAEPVAATQAAPPPGWSVAAKAEFDKLSPAVQEAVAKRKADVSAGFARYEGLGQYVEMAQKAGKTLPEVVQNYVATENLLGEDFGSGILQLCRFYNVDPAQLGQFLQARERGDRHRVRARHRPPRRGRSAPGAIRAADRGTRSAGLGDGNHPLRR